MRWARSSNRTLQFWVYLTPKKSSYIPTALTGRSAKFAGREEPEWQQISGILVHGAACAVDYRAYGPTMTLRHMTQIHPVNEGTVIGVIYRIDWLTI